MEIRIRWRRRVVHLSRESRVIFPEKKRVRTNCIESTYYVSVGDTIRREARAVGRLKRMIDYTREYTCRDVEKNGPWVAESESVMDTVMCYSQFGLPFMSYTLSRNNSSLMMGESLE